MSRTTTAESKTELLPPLGTITLKSGGTLDLGALVWAFPTAGRLIDWSTIPITNPSLFAAAKRYAAFQARELSIHSLSVFWTALQKLELSKVFAKADRNRGDIPAELFTELMEKLKVEQDHWQTPFNALRRWYYWCATHDYPGFNKDVAREIKKIRVTLAASYRPVLGSDDGDGALSDLEKRILVRELKRAEDATDVLSLSDLVLIWILLYIGANPDAIRALRESDLFRQGPYWILNMPRHKKKGAMRSLRPRPRRIPPHLASLIQRLIKGNRRERRKLKLNQEFDWPIFYRQDPLPGKYGDPIQPWHQTPGALSSAVQKMNAALNLLVQDGTVFRIHARRFRYTLATDLIDNGATPDALVDALDHSTDKWILRYYGPKHTIIPKLDAALALEFAPIIDAFQGKIVKGPEEAPRGVDPASFIRYGDPKEGIYVGGVGSCGCFGKCGLAATINCYVCRLYHPWANAPHELILKQLIRERDEALADGLDQASVKRHDDYIFAVAQVIRLCQDWKKRDALKHHNTKEKH